MLSVDSVVYSKAEAVKILNNDVPLEYIVFAGMTLSDGDHRHCGDNEFLHQLSESLSELIVTRFFSQTGISAIKYLLFGCSRKINAHQIVYLVFISIRQQRIK